MIVDFEFKYSTRGRERERPFEHIDTWQTLLPILNDRVANVVRVSELHNLDDTLQCSIFSIGWSSRQFSLQFYSRGRQLFPAFLSFLSSLFLVDSHFYSIQLLLAGLSLDHWCRSSITTPKMTSCGSLKLTHFAHLLSFLTSGTAVDTWNWIITVFNHSKKALIFAFYFLIQKS